MQLENYHLKNKGKIKLVYIIYANFDKQLHYLIFKNKLNKKEFCIKISKIFLNNLNHLLVNV